MFLSRSPNGSQMEERRVNTHILMQLQSNFRISGTNPENILGSHPILFVLDQFEL
jgi:hypothetical protein